MIVRPRFVYGIPVLAPPPPILQSGVAPLSVHLFSDYATEGDESDRFRNCFYEWDFGDPESGVWAATGKPKNKAYGAATAHVFEEPGTYRVDLEVRDDTGVVATESYGIEVLDPDLVYAGMNTTCVTNAGDSDFTGSPVGSRQISTDDLSTITQYAEAGNRILFKRGASWTTAGLSWPSNAGPVTIGAYGSGAAPEINVSSGTFLSLGGRQDWRVVDLHLNGVRDNNAFSGAVSMQRLLIMRVSAMSFDWGINISHWNGSDSMQNRDIAIVDCQFVGSVTYGAFIGAERLVIMGSMFLNTEYSHAFRAWQAYRSVISNNVFAGTNIVDDRGRQALTVRGPDESSITPTPSTGTGELVHRTEFTVISDNIVGGSGPWPTTIAPQNETTDARISNIIFERNRIASDYGEQAPTLVSQALLIGASYVAVRNNIFDATGSANSYTAVRIYRLAATPHRYGNEVYNNTFFRSDAATGTHTAVLLQVDTHDAVVRNNLVSYPAVTGTVNVISDSSTGLVESNNLSIDDPLYQDPDNEDPLARDFRLQDGSAAIDAGTTVPVFDDHSGAPRPNGADFDLGAFEFEGGT